MMMMILFSLFRGRRRPPPRRSSFVFLVALFLCLFGMTATRVCEGLSLGGGGGGGIKNDAAASSITRRDFMHAAPTLAVLAGSSSLLGRPAGAAISATDSSSSEQPLPFCVIGANGRTGTKCVAQLLQANLPVRATSRSGIYYNKDTNNEAVLLEASSSSSSSSLLLQPMVCDVTQPETIATAVRGTRAVIFAASASKQGGTAAQVDNDGLVAVAKACIANRVPHLVVVSSGGVSKPDSTIYKFLNVFGGIMEQKIQGEDLVRNLYSATSSMSSSSSSSSSNSDGGDVDCCTYTIIRPGGLTEEPGLGAAALELNQGDVKSGRISRNDVASLCIQSTLYPKLTGGTTFECYNADTGKALGAVGFSNLMKQKTDPTATATTTTTKSLVTGQERRGETWESLFTGLEKA